MEAKEEIRARLNIEDVIGEYVQLKRAGRNYKGLSPFSSEKTPSFMVSPDKHIWHDFSSNKGGDIFAFVMEVEGLDFRGAMELLARKANVDLSQVQTKGSQGLSKKKDRLYQILDLAVRFYQQSMISNKTALEYIFKKRGLSKEVVQSFGIGYSPQSDAALLQALLKRGYKESELRDAGLVVTRRGRPGDMFRGRMMVPLADGQGRTVGFTARLIADQPNAPKYINTPQTLLYDKGRQVFGLHLAKEAIRKSDYVVIVEGNLDVVSSHQAGIGQVVATAGTAMTEDHLRSLSRLTHDIRLSFDRDKAGIAATERAIGIASKLGLRLSIITLPEGYKDPDEAIQADSNIWLAAIQTPQDAFEWLLDYYSTLYDLSTAEGKRRVTSKALELVAALNDPVEREHYLGLISEVAHTSMDALIRKIDLFFESKNQTKMLAEVKAKPGKMDSTYLYQDRLLSLLLAYVELRFKLASLKREYFEGDLRRKVFDFIKWLDDRKVDDALLSKLQSDEIRVKIKELIFLQEQKFPLIEDSLYDAVKNDSKTLLLGAKEKEQKLIANELNNMSDSDPLWKEKYDYLKLLRDEISNLKSRR